MSILLDDANPGGAVAMLPSLQLAVNTGNPYYRTAQQAGELCDAPLALRVTVEVANIAYLGLEAGITTLGELLKRIADVTFEEAIPPGRMEHILKAVIADLRGIGLLRTEGEAITHQTKITMIKPVIANGTRSEGP